MKKSKQESEEIKIEEDIRQVENIFVRYGLERESEVVTAKINQYYVARRSESQKNVKQNRMKLDSNILQLESMDTQSTSVNNTSRILDNTIQNYLPY